MIASSCSESSSQALLRATSEKPLDHRGIGPRPGRAEPVLLQRLREVVIDPQPLERDRFGAASVDRVVVLVHGSEPVVTEGVHARDLRDYVGRVHDALDRSRGDRVRAGREPPVVALDHEPGRLVLVPGGPEDGPVARRPPGHCS